MLAASASLLNVNIIILDDAPHAPAKQIINPTPPFAHLQGSFKDPEKVKELGAKVDVMTVEIEHVHVDVLEDMQKTTNIEIHPSPQTLRIIQDKFLQKEHLKQHNIPIPGYARIDSSLPAIQDAASLLGLPLMLKSRTLAYDGRGNFVLRNLDQASEALSFLQGRPLYVEQWAPFVKEVAVMVVRSTRGDVQSYPTVETIHENNICHLVFAPLRHADYTVEARARSVAEEAVKTLSGAGIFGVEMFLMADGDIPSILYCLMQPLTTRLFPQDQYWLTKSRLVPTIRVTIPSRHVIPRSMTTISAQSSLSLSALLRCVFPPPPC